MELFGNRDSYGNSALTFTYFSTLLSGRTHISYAIDAFKAGAFDYVTKPIVSMDIFINGLRNRSASVSPGRGAS